MSQMHSTCSKVKCQMKIVTCVAKSKKIIIKYDAHVHVNI